MKKNQIQGNVFAKKGISLIKYLINAKNATINVKLVLPFKPVFYAQIPQEYRPKIVNARMDFTIKMECFQNAYVN